MALTINTNIMSLNAQKNLRQTQAPLQQAMQRLSSGMRVNSSKDDAAGLAIATRMTRQINGLSQASRNANSGISFAQTAESAMDEMINGVQRIYELAQQAASYNTSADRSSLNQEVTELQSELSRIVTQTRYNGEQFLNQQKSVDIQVGTEVKETINISTSSLSPHTLGLSTNYSDSLPGADVAKAAALSYGNSLVGGSTALSATTCNSAASNATTVAAGFMTINGVQVGGFSASVNSSTAAARATLTNMLTAINNKQNGNNTTTKKNRTTTTNTTKTNMLSAINVKSSTTGVTAYFMDKSDYTVSSTASASSTLVFANTTGAAIDVSLNSSVSGGSLVGNALASSAMSVAAGQNGKIILNSDFTTTSVSMNGTATGAAFGVGSSSSSVGLTATSLNNVSVTTAAGANIAILAAKQSLETFVNQKAKLGAKLNRLESTIRNIEGTNENITAAKSRIMDADFAAETAKMTKSMILQQAGISVLAQANQARNNVLALLR